MIEGQLHWHTPIEDALVEGAEVRERTDLEGGVLESGVTEEGKVDRNIGRMAAEEYVLAKVGRLCRDHLKAKHLPVKFSDSRRVPRAEGDVADTHHPRRFCFLIACRQFHGPKTLFSLLIVLL